MLLEILAYDQQCEAKELPHISKLSDALKFSPQLCRLPCTDAQEDIESPTYCAIILLGAFQCANVLLCRAIGNVETFSNPPDPPSHLDDCQIPMPHSPFRTGLGHINPGFSTH